MGNVVQVLVITGVAVYFPGSETYVLEADKTIKVNIWVVGEGTDRTGRLCSS